ncbi:MAG: hypothetical protein AAFA34_00800, partial [Thermoplasmata archaeon]
LSGRLEVGGRASIDGALRAREVEIGGRLEAERAVAAESLEVGGAISTRAGARAGRLRLGKRSTSRGPLIGDRVELGAHSTAEEVFGTSVLVDHDARVRRIVAEEVELRAGAEVDEVVYLRQLRVDPKAQAGNARQVGTLPPFPL